MTEGIDIPTQDEVDAFLPPPSFNHVVLDPNRPMAVDSLTSGNLLMKYRENHLGAMQAAKKVIADVDKAFVLAGTIQTV